MKTKPTGCNCPLSLQQISSWIFILIFVISYYVFIIPFKPLGVLILMGLIFTAAFLILMILGLKITFSDPTDKFVGLFNESIKTNRQFSEVVSNFCALCSTPVQEESKHCMVCYRCVDKFDHHCTWVNNCIGGINYSLFIKLIFALEAFLVIVLTSGIDALLTYFKSSNEYQAKFEELYQSQNYLIGVCMIFFSTITCGVLMIFTTYLIVFHLYIIRKGKSTYQYLRRNKVSADRTREKCNDSEIVALKD